MRENISDGFTLNMTSKVTLPDVDYINELAREKKFSLGRSFKSAPKILEDLYYLFRKENQDGDEFVMENYVFPTKYIEEEILFRELSPEEAAYYKYTLLFLKKIDFGNTVGITPLDKALNVLMYMVQLSKKTNPKGNPSDGYSHYDETNDPNPGDIQVPNEEALAEAMKELAGENVGSGEGKDATVAPPGQGGEGSGSASDSDDDSLSDSITKCVRDHLYDLTPSIANVYGVSKPADVPINRKILGDIKIKAYLENAKGMETSLDSKKKRNNDSTERNTLRMEEHAQITKVRKSQMMMDTFDDKLIKKELNVKEKVKPEEKKQILYMLLDDSGSMGCKIKQTYVRAVLLNRLESVVDGKSELQFCLYESNRYGFHEVKDKKDAQKLYKTISLRRPRGGGTYIGNVLQETINEIHNKEGYHDPEIMIVCDGDDHVNPEKVDPKGVRINVVLLGTTNPGLQTLATQTGGFFTCEQLYNRY